jgi:hypothetical protein
MRVCRDGTEIWSGSYRASSAELQSDNDRDVAQHQTDHDIDRRDNGACGRGRHIPVSWQVVGSRTSLYKVAGNRNAAHPVNAMLNYAYAVLESQVRIQAVSDGFDPTRGIMHETREGSSAFVFDMMEPERPKVDRAVLEFVKANPLHAADFTIRSDGVCRLNPEMARRLVSIILNVLNDGASSREVTRIRRPFPNT